MCSVLFSCAEKKEYVDYVNPYVGGISHLLVPALPTVQLPNGMLRVYPDRKDYTAEYVEGLPVAVTNHRERSAFKLWPLSGNSPCTGIQRYNYDNEHITPYGFDVDLADNTVHASYALSYRSAVYEIDFRDTDSASLAIYTPDGQLYAGENCVYGWQRLPNDTRVYLYMESGTAPSCVEEASLNGNGSCVRMTWPRGCRKLRLRYGISLIDTDQAKANLRREIGSYDVAQVAEAGRKAWNEALGRIEVRGGTDEELETFYSFYYRTFERPVCISEDGRYFSASDHQVHEDARPFYTDDWLWDTYRAAHPLRSLTDAAAEEDIISSFLRMAVQKGDMWMPTFPEINGDSRRMNSNHGIPVVAEALALGLDIDLGTAYEICSRAVDEKTLAPWSGNPAGWIDGFYKEHRYIPALAPGEKESDPNVHPLEKRQPVAVTLGTAYDQWCLSLMAADLGMDRESAVRADYATGYRSIFNPETRFFHPKDKYGRWIPDIDYSFCGGMGAREYYGENNAWVYRWDVPHNIADLVAMMGGEEEFCAELDRTFSTPLGRPKFEFYSMLPDHTGNVGQFSMANEPSLHVPYLYNYAGKPWKTQKRIRQMLHTWFRNDLMGIPGDEDGGGMSAFAVFSYLGFYPVTPGTATYNIGSPVFPETLMHLGNGNTLRIVARNVSFDNKYIQSATLNGRPWNKPWFSYEDVKDGALIILEMGPLPNREWGLECPPPSAGL